MISVIIPAYNTADTLPTCLDSVIAQSVTDWECIVINDGSTDNTLDILHEYSLRDKRFKIVNQVNSGVSGARNRGIDIASGDFVTFIDSDDYVEPDYFKQVLDVISETNAEMLISGYVEERKTGEGADKVIRCCSLMPKQYIPWRDNIYLLNRNKCVSLLFDISASYWGYIRNWFRLSTIKKHEIYFNNNLKYNEDRFFTMSYLAAEQTNAVNVVLNRSNYHYVIRNGSAMNQQFNRNHLIELDSFRLLCALERKSFRDKRINMAIRHAGLTRKYYLTWLAMSRELYDTISATYMEAMEADMLSLRDFLPPYTSCSKHMMKRWLQRRKDHVFTFFGLK